MEVDVGVDFVSGNEKLILGRLRGDSGEGVAMGVFSSTTGWDWREAVGIDEAIEGALGWDVETGAVTGLGAVVSTSGIFLVDAIRGCSVPKISCKEGISGISSFLISAKLNSREIFSRVVDVMYPSNRLSFNSLSKRSIAN
ncbi:MAG: hypothetical protein ACXACR_13925 [Candidatus Hodarchaeales archaeon]|jgi:hypothetical protein